MKQKSIAFFLVICMLFSLFTGSAAYAGEADARTQGMPVETDGDDDGTQETPSGLTAAWDIEWDDDGNPVGVMDGAEYGKDQGADILYDAVWSVKNDGETVSANALHVFWQNVENDGAFESEDGVVIESCGTNGDLLQFSFPKRGKYHISLSENSTGHTEWDEEAETEDDDCIKVWVDFPKIGFYSEESNGELSEEYLIKDEIEYSAGDAWYVLTSPSEGYDETKDVSIEPLWETPEVLFDIETIKPDGTYKVTAKADVDFSSEDDPDWSGIGLRVKCTVQETYGNEWDSEWEQRFRVADKEKTGQGLLATQWAYFDEDQEKVMIDNDLNGFEKIKWIALEDGLCFKYHDGSALEPIEWEDGSEGQLLVSDPISAADIKLYAKDENGKLVLVPEDEVTMTPDEEVEGMIHFSFRKCGQYLASYEKDGIESSAILHVDFPWAAFYTGTECTENTIIRGQKSYGRNDRTFYLVLHEENETDEEGNVTACHPVQVNEPEITHGGDKVRLEKQSDTVYKITVNDGVKEEIDVEAKWQLKWADEDEDPEGESGNYAFVHLFYEQSPEVTALTVTPKTVELEAGEKAELKAEAKGEDGTPVITFKSGDEKIAAVDAKGLVTGVKEGKTEITVTAALGKSTKTETVTVTVKSGAVAQKNAKAEDGAKVTTKADGTATVNTAVAKKNAKSVKVADTVKVNGVTYTVTTVAKNAFKSVSKTVTSITLPATITQIDKNAFKGLKKLKKITMKVTAPVKVAKGAFSGVDTKKVTITVSKKMSKKDLKKFKNDLKKAGFKGTVKAK